MNPIIFPSRTIAPKLGKPHALNIKKPENLILNNGVPVFLIPDESQQVTRLDVVFDAGNAFQKRKLQADAVNKLLSEGTKSHTSMEIAEILDFYGAQLNPFLSKDKAGITLFGLTKYYDSLLPLIAEILTQASFLKEEIDIYEDRKKQQFLVNIQKVSYRASLEFNKLIFGENSAYGQVLNEHDFGQLTRENLLDFYQKHYQPQDSYMVVSGKITSDLLKLLSNVLGDNWGNTGLKPIVNLDYIEPVSQKQKLLEKGNALQSALRIGGIALSRNHPDFPRLRLLNTVFGGYFGSRLMSNLREDKGYTYGVNSFIQNFRHGDYLAIATEVNVQYTAAAIKEIRLQMELLCKEEIPREELHIVKNYVYGASLRNFDGPFSIADRFLNSLELGLKFSVFKKELEGMMKLTPADLLETARKYLNFKDMKILVVGKVDDLLPKP